MRLGYFGPEGTFTQEAMMASTGSLIFEAVPLPTISAVLGHAAEDSTSVYMSADRERLLQCVLPVPAGARQ